MITNDETRQDETKEQAEQGARLLKLLAKNFRIINKKINQKRKVKKGRKERK